MKFDEFLGYIGGFGRYQKKIYLLLSIPLVLLGMQLMAPIFILDIPAHRCAVPGLENDTFQITDEYHQSLVDMYIPHQGNGTRTSYSKCTRYDLPPLNALSRNPRSDISHSQSIVITCDRWVYDQSVFTSTVASETNLVCDKSIFVAHATIALNVGSLVAFLTMGVFSDRFGRKKTYMVELLILGIFTTVLIWLPNVYAFIVFRFAIGFGFGGFINCAFIYALEFIGPTKRTALGIFMNNFWGFGLFIHVAMAYGIRDWRYLQLATALPQVVKVIPESPRWLLVKGQTKAGITILKKMAKVNKVNISESSCSSINIDTEDDDQGAQGSIIDLFKSKRLAITTLIVFFNWMIVAMVYYGLTLGIGNLGGNLYLNYLYTSLVEFMAYLACIPALFYVGRKYFHAACMILSGVALLLVIFPEKYSSDGTWTVVLFLIGKFGSSAAFATIYLFTVEVFPTIVRNSALGASAFFSGVGTIKAPYIAQLAAHMENQMDVVVPLLVFGCTSITAGLLALFLPETRNRPLPDRLTDMEASEKL